MQCNSRLCTCIRSLLSLFLEGTEFGYPGRQQQFFKFSNLCVWSIDRRYLGPTSSSFRSSLMVGLTKGDGESRWRPQVQEPVLARFWAGSGGFVITGPVCERRSITANNISGERKKVEMYMFVRSKAIHDYLFTWIIRLSQTQSQQFQFIRPAQGDLTVWLMGLTELMSFLQERHGVADVAIGSCTSCCQFLGKSWLAAGGPRGLIRVRTGWPPARARGRGLLAGSLNWEEGQ